MLFDRTFLVKVRGELVVDLGLNFLEISMLLSVGNWCGFLLFCEFGSQLVFGVSL